MKDKLLVFLNKIPYKKIGMFSTIIFLLGYYISIKFKAIFGILIITLGLYTIFGFGILYMLKLYLENSIWGYKPDFQNICLFKEEFERYGDISILREKVITKLRRENINDWCIMLKVEIEEINKMSYIYETIPLIIFLLGIVSFMYKNGDIWFFIIGVLCIIAYISYANNRAIKYYKYYIFLKEIINKYFHVN